MVAENGIVVVESGEWKRLIVPKELEAKQIIFHEVSVTELVIESGTDCVLNVKGGTIETVVVPAPQVKEISFAEIEAMLQAGQDASEVANLYRDCQLEKEKRMALIPTIITDGETTIGTVQISGNVNLNVSKDNVENIVVESVGDHTKLQVEIANYTGAVTVKQEKAEKTSWNLLHLTLKDSTVTELHIDSKGGSTCSINERGNSQIGTVAVEGNSSVNLSVPVEKLNMTEQAVDAFVKLYANAKEVVVEGKQSDIMLTAAATVENAVVSGDSIRIYGYGTLESAQITGEKANVSTPGTNVEGKNDTTIP